MPAPVVYPFLLSGLVSTDLVAAINCGHPSPEEET
jgi:hypothetical protein